MSVAKSQIKPDEAISKTVKQVYENGDGLVVVFTDDTYIYASMVSSWGDYYFSAIHSFTEEARPQDLLAIGIISQSKYKEIRRKEKAEAEQHERERYEQLRRKFEKP